MSRLSKPVLVVLACAAISTVIAAPADAKRAPTVSERKAIRSAIDSFIDARGSPAASDNRVKRIRMSTVDGHFARVDLFSPSAGPSTALLKKRRTGWKVVGFGSADFSCSLAPDDVWSDLYGGGSAWSPDDDDVVPYAGISVR